MQRALRILLTAGKDKKREWGGENKKNDRRGEDKVEERA